MSRNRSPELTHLDDDGRLRMVDVGAKDVTTREAVASALVRMSRATLKLVSGKALPKGDVIATAKIAGILAAKQTSSLIPLTHPLSLNFIDIAFRIDTGENAIEVTSTVRCDGKTGVEIEAMTACAIACLTIYDMCKSAERGVTIERLQLVEKSGGKSGHYRRNS